MTQRHKVKFLDLVMIRSCQMACEGCCTFSDHKEINGLLDVKDAEESVKFFSKFLDPGRVHLFGGEPLMHPQFMNWFRLAFKYWPADANGHRFPIWLNTNGYFLDKLFDHIDELFLDNFTAVSVTHHTTMEPYATLVVNNYYKLQELIIEAHRRRFPKRKFQWIDDADWSSEHKKFNVLTDESGPYLMMNMTFQHDDHFVSHYRGKGIDLAPWHDYNHDTAMHDNHRQCHIADYVQLYQGRLWKCPPRAVLNQTLETYDLQNDPAWAPYYNNYESIGTDATDDQVHEWFERRKNPEKTCNMCGFMYSDKSLIPAQQHLPKKLFKLKPA